MVDANLQLPLCYLHAAIEGHSWGDYGKVMSVSCYNRINKFLGIKSNLVSVLVHFVLQGYRPSLDAARKRKMTVGAQFKVGVINTVVNIGTNMIAYTVKTLIRLFLENN